jgi:hypothetical protein
MQPSIASKLPSPVMSENPGASGEVGKGELSGDELVAAFARWAADQRVNEAARRRSRERWLRQQATEDATMAGILTDLAERRAEVVANTRTHQVAGRMLGVAKDFFVIEGRDGAGVLVATEHLARISPLSREAQLADPSGDRPPPLSLRLIDAFAMLASDRRPIRLGLIAGEAVAGDLVAVGRDVVTLRANPRAVKVFVAFSAIEVCTPC